MDACSSRRSPYGERGLKSFQRLERHGQRRSLSLRRAWIEIAVPDSDSSEPGRSPYGERGLKLRRSNRLEEDRRRSPYGERGLKYRWPLPEIRRRRSLSLRRAWIEIFR